MSTFGDTLARCEQDMKNLVMAETWGHLYPPLGNKFRGVIEFVCGGYSAVDCQPCFIHFEGLDDSPVLYDDVTNFLMDTFSDNEEYASVWGRKHLPCGLYRWEGVYRKCKNETAIFQKGKITCLHLFTIPA